VIGLAWSETGVRHLTNNQRPVRGPDDLKGLTIRVQENEVHQQAFRALGANVVAMPLGQLQAAIEQGTVNGQENPLWVLMLTRLPQVQKHLSLTGHVYNAGIIVMSKSAHERLSPNDRNAFVEAAQSAALATRRKIDELEANGLTQLRNSGLEIIEEVDRGAFQRALQPLTLEWRRRLVRS